MIAIHRVSIAIETWCSWSRDYQVHHSKNIKYLFNREIRLLNCNQIFNAIFVSNFKSAVLRIYEFYSLTNVRFRFTFPMTRIDGKIQYPNTIMRKCRPLFDSCVRWWNKGQRPNPFDKCFILANNPNADIGLTLALSDARHWTIWSGSTLEIVYTILYHTIYNGSQQEKYRMNETVIALCTIA